MPPLPDPDPLAPIVPVSKRASLSEFIRSAELQGYFVSIRLVPNTCPHGPPCCDACKALPENQHTLTVY